MSNLIRKEEVINIIHNKIQSTSDFLQHDVLIDVEFEVDELPTVEAKEVVYSYIKTVVGKMGVMHQECSSCGNILEWKAYPNYCDECGAKLDGVYMRTSAE